MHRVCFNPTRKAIQCFQDVVSKQRARWMSSFEVERKFVPAADFHKQVEILIHSSNSTSSESIWRAEDVLKIRDVYFDLRDQLSSKGVWIRHRTTSVVGSRSPVSSCWDAKKRLGGNFIDSEFEEIQGEREIRELLSTSLPGMTLEGLDVLADLESTRSGWTIRPASSKHTDDHGRLSIVLDTVVPTRSPNPTKNYRTMFRHEIGEVEVTRPMAPASSAAAHGEYKASELRRMRAQIDEFMDKHPALFSNAKPIGKLSAYLTWVRNH